MMPHFREKWGRLWPRLGIIAIAAFAIISTTIVTLQIREEIRQNSFSVYAALAGQRRTENAEKEQSQQADAWPEAAAKVPDEEFSAGEMTEDTEEHLIYASPSGKRYHDNPQCPGKNGVQITWDDVRRRGLTPCKKCVK